MIEQNHEIIDIDEVVKSLQEAQEQQVVQPEPVSSEGGRTVVMGDTVRVLLLVPAISLLLSQTAGEIL